MKKYRPWNAGIVSCSVAALFSCSLFFSTRVLAQREIGAQSLALDDGFGNVVDITIPHMTGPGPYSWVLPITATGTALSLPAGTMTNSTLSWNGTTWTENTSLLMPSTGTLSAPSSSGGAGTDLSLRAGNSGGANNGANALLAGGDGLGGVGGSVELYGGSGLTGGNANLIGGTGFGTAAGDAYVEGGYGWPFGVSEPGGSVYVLGGHGTASGLGSGSGGNVTIGGGVGAGPAGTGGYLQFQTTPTTGALQTRMTITNAGIVEIGSSNQFQVDNSGNMSTSGSTTAATGLSIAAGAAANAANTIQWRAGGNNGSLTTASLTGTQVWTLPNATGTLAVSGRGAKYQATPANPAGTGTATVQMGLAGTITPSTSGTVMLIISGTIANSLAGNGATVAIRYGTGAAPANGDAPTGTVVGNLVNFSEPINGYGFPFTTNAVLTGLALGTTYWIDLQLTAGPGGTASVSQISISAMEMP